MSLRIDRRTYAQMFGPTVGDRVRLADTELFIEVERDFTVYGDEVKFGGGKVLRDGMGQSPQASAAEAPDLLITNALIVDHWGIVKADIGIKDGRIIAASIEPMADGGYVSTHQDVTDPRRAEAKIAHMATHDALTDLPNRVLFQQRLKQAVGGVRQGDRKLAVLLLDLDRRFGAGDQLLNVTVVCRFTRPYDRHRRAVENGVTVREQQEV